MVSQQEYELRRAIAMEQFARVPGADLPKQKFKRGSRVKVCQYMPPHMVHFPSDFEAIVYYTYGQKYGGNDYKQYSLVCLEGSSDRVTNCIAWYDEDQLTLLNDDIANGLKIIESVREEAEKCQLLK